MARIGQHQGGSH